MNSKLRASTIIDVNKINYLYTNPNWVDIPSFFKYIKPLQKGDIYRLIGVMVKHIDDDWVYTYTRNSNKHYTNFTKFIYSLGCSNQIVKSLENTAKLSGKDKFKAGCSQHRNMPRAQALDDIISFPSHVNQAVNGLNDVIPLLANAANGITSVTSSITSMMTFVTEVVTHWRTTMNTMIETITTNAYLLLEYLVKLVALAYLLTQPNNQNLANAIALLTLILPTNITAGILPFAEGLIRVIKGMMGVQAQEDDDNNSGFIRSFYQLTLGITKGLFGEVPKEVFDSLNISSRKVRLISDYIKGTSTIFDCLTKIFYKAVEWIGDGVFKYFGYAPMFLKEETLSPMIDEFLQMKLDRMDQQCTIHVDAARKVVNLYERLLQYEGRLNRNLRAGNNTNFKQAPYLRVMIKALESCVNRIPDHLRTGLTPRRIKPFWIYLYGDPRIGKTAVLQPHLVNALSKSLKLINKYEDYTNYTYLRNCGEDYWEGYDNHPVLWYNDLFQNYAQEEKMHQAIMELTNIVDDNVYPLEMAFERKHCVYFSSEVVISNAQHDIINAGFIQNKCWSGGSHLFARRNICLKLSLNPKYADTIGINYAVMKQEMLANPHVCVGYEYCTQFTQAEYDAKLLFPSDMYVMEFTDPTDGKLILVTDYPTGIDYICQQAIDYKATQGAFKNKLYNHFEGMWAQAGDDEDDSTLQYYDARVTTMTEQTEYILSEALRCLEEAVPGFTGTNEVYTNFNARYVDNPGRYQYYANFISDNRTNPRRAFAKIALSVEIIGGEHYMMKNMTFWTKITTLCKKWLTISWANARQCIKSAFEIMGPYRQLGEFFLKWFLFYKIFSKYVEYIGHLFQPYNKCDCKSTNAQSHEAKMKPPVPQILRVAKKSGVLAQSYDQQNTIVEGIINKQMCKFTIRIFKEDIEVHNRRFGSGLCLGSDIFVLPYHFWFRWIEMKEYWEQHNCVVKICLNWNDVLEVNLDWQAMTLCRLNYNHTEDLAYIRIKNLVQRPHLKKFFISSNDRPILSSLYVYGKRANSFELTTMGVSDGEYKLTTYLHESRDDPLYGGKFAKREICIPVALHYYNCCTSAGDCGTMVLHCDSALNCKKIMAMHTAGHTVDGYGIGSLIFQEDIEEVFNFFYPDSSAISPIAMEYDDVEDDLKLGEMGLQVMGKVPRLVIPSFGIDKSPVLMMPRKSRISHSVVYDIMEEDFGQSTVKPAHLRPYMLNEMRMSPLYTALKKMAVVSPMPDERITQEIVQHMYETVAMWPSSTKPRVFTDSEMINGYGLMNAIEMSTSAGYPYVVINNSSGKHPFFEIDEQQPLKYRPSFYLQEQLDARELDASKGIITQTYFIDTLKDETRPIEKVDQGKTRLFQIAPLDFNLLLRKYFGAFLIHAQEAFIVGEGAVGVNANSYEWTLMMKDLLEVGDCFVNGDGRNFDASASQPIAMHTVEVINKWYQLGKDWRPSHDRIRRVLWCTFLNSLHIVRNLVYRAQQGNKSGTAVTTWFNNLMGMFGVRWTFILCGYQLHNFHRAIKPKFYGDDDLISVNKQLAPLFTCLKHKETMALMGIEYTSATKGDVIDGWYNITEISFLKRKFVWDGVRYLPQLDHVVVYEISRWSESDPLNMVDQMNRFNSTLLEVSNYGRQEFNHLRNKFVEYSLLIRRRGLVIDPTHLFGYDYCEYIKWGDLYKPAQLSIDLARASDVERVVQYESAADDVKLSKLDDNLGLESSNQLQTANSQTHESKNLPPKAQIIRISRPKAQGEEEDQVKDFELYLTMMEYLKELEPCFKNFERAMLRSIRQPIAKWSISQLHFKVSTLLRLYAECTNLIKGAPEAQGDEFRKIESMTFTNSNAKIIDDVDDALQGASVVQQKTTTFVNSVTAHQPTVIHTTVPKPDNSNLYTNMELYFKRPTLVDSFMWNTTDTIWQTKGTWHFPQDYLKIPQIASKLAMVMYARPDMEFEIICNSTKFHYGKMVFCVMPFYSTTDAAGGKIPACYDSPYNAFTWPHWYQITAGSGQSVKFTVPYRHMMSQIQLNSTIPQNRRMFSIKSYISVPLQSANSTTAGPVEISIFANFIEPRLFGNIYTGALTQGEEVSLSKQQVVVANPINYSSQRVVSAALDGVSKITRDMSQLAYKAGFSMPANLSSTNSMQIRQPLLNKVSDLPNVVVLGGDQQAQLTTSPEFVNSETPDDMNINYICASPCLLTTIKINPTDTVGKRLLWQYLTPQAMNFSGEGYTGVAGAHYPLPVSYISQYFNMWRGSWKFHFVAVSSAFHSMRLRISYLPAGMANSMGLPAETLDGVRDTAYTRNVVWDINQNTELTVRIPYETNTHWRFTDVSVDHCLGGVLLIQVLNQLSSATASSTVTPIYLQVFVSCDDDFQFTHPARRAIGDTRQWAPDVTLAQGEEVEGCSLPSSSSTCLREQKGLLMGDIDSRCRKYHDNVSMTYTSLKQLVNQLTPVEWFESTEADTVDVRGRRYTPFGSGVQAHTYTDSYWLPPIHTVTALFRFARGSFRMHMITNDKLQIGAYAVSFPADIGTYGVHNVDVMNGEGAQAEPLGTTTYGFAQFYDNTVYPADVVVPYYHALPNLLTYNSKPFVTYMVPTVSMTLSTQKSEKKIIVCVGGGDDYILGYRMSIPRIRDGAVAALLSVGKRSTNEKTVAPPIPLASPTVQQQIREQMKVPSTPGPLKRTRRSFIDRLMETPNEQNSNTDDESEE